MSNKTVSTSVYFIIYLLLYMYVLIKLYFFIAYFSLLVNPTDSERVFLQQTSVLNILYVIQELFLTIVIPAGIYELFIISGPS